MKKDVLVIMMGGTIDAEPYPDPAHPPPRAIMLKNSLVPNTVSEMGHASRCDFLPWRPKDSNEFKPEEMLDLARIIRTSRAKYVIITHGTDTMPEHARDIMQRLQSADPGLRGDHPSGATVTSVRGEKPVKDKVVVFTGAMVPLANGPESDGHKNLKHIFDHLQQWKPGVRVVMHGKSFQPSGLTKNFDTYTFEGKEIPDKPVVWR